MATERYPLSRYLPDPSHTEMWMSQLPPRELRTLRLVSSVWSNFLMKDSIWAKFSMDERPVDRNRYPELSWAQPFDWGLLSELDRHALAISDPDYDGWAISRAVGHRFFRGPDRVENVVAAYDFFHDDHLLGVFLRKFLFYHVEIVYSVLLWQTMVTVNQDYENSASYFVSFLPPLWGFFLMLNFMLFHIGIYISLTYYDVLRDNLSVSLPIFGLVKVDTIGMLYFFYMVPSFALFFHFSTVDIILLSIWNLLFYHCQVRYRRLSYLTSQKCDNMWEGFSVALMVICIVQFICLHPVFTTFLYIFALLVFDFLRAYQRRIRPPFNWKDREYRIGISWVFGLSLVGQLWFHSNTLLGAIIVSLLQGLVLPVIAIYLESNILNALRDSVEKSARDQVIDYLLSVSLKVRFFQFFTAFYVLRLLALILGQ